MANFNNVFIGGGGLALLAAGFRTKSGGKKRSVRSAAA